MSESLSDRERAELTRLREEVFRWSAQWEAMESALCHHCSRAVERAVREIDEEEG